MFTIPTGYVNVAALVHSTNSLGPGERAVVWVQGCLLHCPGCLAPDWLPHQPARLMHVEELSDELLTSPEVHGIVFSGGEPMLQAHSLACVAKLIRRKRSINLITFTGFRYEHLLEADPKVGYHDLLAQTDVLVDGPYLQGLNDGKGLRGSSNQRIIHLTSQLRDEDLDNTNRRVEMRLYNGNAHIVGIPTSEIQQSLLLALSGARFEKVEYERI